MIRFSQVAVSLFLVAGAAGCMNAIEPGERGSSGECPAGEVCSDTTPNGLHFGGARLTGLLIDAPAATAIGGTQEISILENIRGELLALDAPYVADDDGGRGVRVVEQLGATVRVEGMGSRSNYLRIVEPGTGHLYDRYQLTGAALESIELTTDSREVIPDGMPVVWGPGRQRVGIALWGDVQHGNQPVRERIVDTSMSIALAGSVRSSWDLVEVTTATAGTHPVVVTAADAPSLTLELDVVSAADDLVLFDDEFGELTAEAGTISGLCMMATNNDRYVYGLTWQYEVAGEPTTRGFDDFQRNCVAFTATGMPGDVLPVTATAGGVTRTFEVQIVASSAKTHHDATNALAPRPTAARAALPLPAAGERANLTGAPHAE